MTFRIQYADGATETLPTLYEAVDAARTDARRTWEDQSYESIEELDDRSEWQTAIKKIEHHLTRTQDGATHLSSPVSYELPNGEVIRITAL